jgi:hypothetical protein
MASPEHIHWFSEFRAPDKTGGNKEVWRKFPLLEMKGKKKNVSRDNRSPYNLCRVVAFPSHDRVGKELL